MFEAIGFLLLVGLIRAVRKVPDLSADDYSYRVQK